MIGSGWRIYNDDVLFGWLRFPDFLVIGKWAQYGLQWHFFGMWIFGLNEDARCVGAAWEAGWCSCRFLHPVDLTAGDDIDEYSNLSYLVTTKSGFPI